MVILNNNYLPRETTLGSRAFARRPHGNFQRARQAYPRKETAMKLALRNWRLAAIMATALAMPQAAQAEIKVGVTIAATGSAAALGGPARNTFTELWPKEIAGEKITVIVLDDASDPGQATTNARRLVTEDKVDVL